MCCLKPYVRIGEAGARLCGLHYMTYLSVAISLNPPTAQFLKRRTLNLNGLRFRNGQLSFLLFALGLDTFAPTTSSSSSSVEKVLAETVSIQEGIT